MVQLKLVVCLLLVLGESEVDYSRNNLIGRFGVTHERSWSVLSVHDLLQVSRGGYGSTFQTPYFLS